MQRCPVVPPVIGVADDAADDLLVAAAVSDNGG